MGNSKLKVNRKRNFSAHHMLLGSARLALKDVEEKRPGWFYSEVTTLTFCGLALEAIANCFGKRFVNKWEDFESSSPTAKLRIICDTLNIKYSAGEEPWGMARWIVKFRNKVAHAKLEIIDRNEIWKVDEYDDRSKRPPESELEKMISPESARKAYDAVQNILDILCDAIPAEQAFGLRSDGWHGSASAH